MVKRLQWLALVSVLSVSGAQAGWAEERTPPLVNEGTRQSETLLEKRDWGDRSQISRLRDLNRSATTVREWMAQVEAATARVTAVKLSRTDTGLEIVLETAEDKPLQVDATKFRTEGNSLIADIPNAVLVLPEATEFSADNPTEAIASVRVVQLDASNIRVSVTGFQTLPTQRVTLRTGELVYSLNPKTPEEDEQLEIVVRGEIQGYRIPETTTATRTDTPIRDIPQSIQVVPQQVLQDRNVRTINETVETVSGVVDGGNYFGSSGGGGGRIIRGFRQDGNFRNGYRDAPNIYILSSPIGTIEQVEVLKGPASVLFGGLEPGGIVNLTTKQPLREPYYNLAFEAGNYGFYQPKIDLSGPLTPDRNLLYRFIASYQGANSYQDFVNTNQTTIAPSITWKLGEQTELNLYYEYTNFFANPPLSYSVLKSDDTLTPRNLFIGYPDLADNDLSAQRFGYTITHGFSDNWQIRSSFAGLIADTRETQVYAIALENDRFADVDAYDLDYGYNNYFAQIDILGKFKTGSISHQLLAGFDFNSFTDTYQGIFNTNLPVQDILNPNYNIPEPDYEPFLRFKNQIESYGFYLQDQIAFSDNFKLLIGGRYDWVSSQFEIGEFGSLGNTTDEPVRSNGAFSPRIGLVYQPSDTVSLYASYSRSFRQETGFSSSAEGFEPTRGTQYEVGVKADFLNRRLSTTLAAYHLTRTNVATTDPNNPQFSIQTGEQRSQGIELDIAGEILPGWRVIGSYAYTDAEVTADNTTPVGNRLPGVPENQASLWTTYEIQTGDFRGLGFGLGLFYVGERQGELANSFQLRDYLRTDAALYYRRDGFKAAINVRNLFDRDYISAGSGRAFLERGAPFTITGSISWEF